MQSRHKLQAPERLKLRKKIETLFQTGEAFSAFPLRVIYRFTGRETPGAAPVQVGFSVPKKKMRKAVHRNRIKRLLRESWRLQKHQLYPFLPDNLQLHCFFIFTGNTIPDFKDAFAITGKAIAMLKKTIPAS